MSDGKTRVLKRGRGRSYELDGSAVQSVTTALGDGYPKPALIGWAARTVAGYAVDHWTELEDLSMSERLRVLEKAQWGERDTAAVRGQDVHKLAERLATGEEIEVPEPLVGFVDAYLAFVREWKPREVLVEATVVNRTCRYMGTLDLVADLADGFRWLIDFKTGASGVWPETALQLSAYRNGETYLLADGTEQTMPVVERTGALWLRADGYDLLPVEAGWDEFRRFQYVQEIAEFAKRRREDVIGEALTPPVAVETVEVETDMRDIDGKPITMPIPVAKP